MIELGPHSKSFPLGAQPGGLADIAQRDWNVLTNDLAFPLAVLRRSALMHNLRWMQDFAQRNADLSPRCLHCNKANGPANNCRHCAACFGLLTDDRKSCCNV